jgi:hypothetical protein
MVRFAYYAVPAGIQLSAKVFDLTTSTIHDVFSHPSVLWCFKVLCSLE